jgi:hypothetical protein
MGADPAVRADVPDCRSASSIAWTPARNKQSFASTISTGELLANVGIAGAPKDPVSWYHWETRLAGSVNSVGDNFTTEPSVLIPTPRLSTSGELSAFRISGSLTHPHSHNRTNYRHRCERRTHRRQSPRARRPGSVKPSQPTQRKRCSNNQSY